MCGICGVVALDELPGKINLVEAMSRCIAHRGPDDEGLHEDDGVALGHRRLSIIDLSSGGHQPMVIDELAIVFNGEIYNHRELREELEGEGVVFTSRSDTEVLLRGFRQWGVGVLDRLRAMFAFAIWDARSGELFCARDPFGKRPFYFAETSDRFVFASEVEALVCGLPSRPAPDPRAVAHYLLKGYSPVGGSIYTGIRTLRPGHWLRFSRSSRHVEEAPFAVPRFQLSSGPASDSDAARLRVEVEKTLERSVERRFESDVPVGVLLSGGVDSSLVTLIAAARAADRLVSASARFPDKLDDEAVHAREVAQRAGTQHVELDIKLPDLRGALARVVEVHGEPFADSSAIPTHAIFQALGGHVKVALTGDGGDEVFAGYADARIFRARDRLAPVLGIGDLVGPDLPARLIRDPRPRVRRLGFMLSGLRRSGAAAFIDAHAESFPATVRRRMMMPAAYDATGREAVDHEAAETFHAGGSTELERYLNANLERLAQGYLVKVDRASMANGVEARAPLLDVDLFQLVAGVPADALLPRGEPKAILKDLLATRMGDGFARRKKMGFSPPLADWLRHPVHAKWAEARLTDPRSYVGRLFRPEAIRTLVGEHLDGADRSGMIWRLLVLDEWHAWAYGERAMKAVAA